MDLEKVNNFIKNKIEENLNLDYKASGSLQRNDKKTNEISKDVSAFANSDGGTIIYGIKEDQVNRHLPESIDPINRKEISKEWLEQVIQGNIRPKIDGIIIYSITVDEDSDQVIYAVQIPKSNTAHQANDKKYYKRYNFNSEAMYDYEIRDILNRTKTPIIDLEFEISKYTYEITNHDYGLPSFTIGKNGMFQKAEIIKKYKTNYTLKVFARNNGRILANYINAYIEIPQKYLKDNDGIKGELTSIFMENTIRDVVDTQIMPGMNGGYSISKYGPSRYDPILPLRCLNIKEISLNENILEFKDIINWIVYSDNSEPRNGNINMSEIEIKEK